MTWNTSADKDVVRCGKQVYNHLGLYDRIAQLSRSVASLPAEIQKMQTLCMTDKKELNGVVRRFLQWNPGNGRKKCLDDLIQRIDEAIIGFCSLDDEDMDDIGDMEVAGPIPQSSTMHKRPANTTSDELALKRMKTNLDSSSRINHVSSSRSTPSTPSTLSVASFLIAYDERDYAAYNVLCQPVKKTECFKDLAWVLQYEIARFLHTYSIRWSQLPFEMLKKFMHVGQTNPRDLYNMMVQWYARYRQSNNQMDEISAVYGHMERCSDHVWTHLETPARNKHRMIHYNGVVTLATGKSPVVQLRAPKVGASNRFFRKYGDTRFLELKLARRSHPSLVRKHMEYFLKPFLLMERTYQFLFVKDDSIILFATQARGLPTISIRDVINWHIPILDNWNMSMSKFASRIGLGYSNSIPTLTFEPDQIRYVDDIYSENRGTVEACMTDGCGIISCAAMKKIMGAQHQDELPCAIQGRIGGAKGVWIISPDLDFSSGVWIEIRSSQRKFKTGTPQFDLSIDPLHYTFDLVNNSVCIHPSNLNTQLIQCLTAGGVTSSIFVDLLKDYLRQLVSVVTEDHSIKLLRDWVAKAGGIMRSRWEMEDTEKSVWREQLIDSDFLGRFLDEEEGDNAEMKPASMKTNDYWKVNAYSGNPCGLHESLIRLLDAGFTLTNTHVAHKVTQVFRDIMHSVTTKYKIEIQQSCTVTCIPDPLGVLNEDEVYLHLSTRTIQDKANVCAGLVLGNVIVTRNPCGLKSDVQKVRAVDCPSLRMYTDVIVFPTKGERSLASKLGGGDYDGDLIFCCWDERIVTPFQSSPIAETSPKIREAFDVHTARVKQELARCRDEPSQELALQRRFISVAIPDGTLGIYENWRTILTEAYSFDHEDVIYLAHMCAKLVDAPKQGLALKMTTLNNDRARFSGVTQPAWFVDKRHKQLGYEQPTFDDNPTDIESLRKTAVTTMDQLYVALLEETDSFTQYAKSMLIEGDVPLLDADLTNPWVNALNAAIELKDAQMEADLRLIQREINRHFDDYIRENQRLHQLHEANNHGDGIVDNMDDDKQYNTLFQLEEFFALSFQQIPSSLSSSILQFDRQVNKSRMIQFIKASYAYMRTVEHEKYSRYCYIVAFDTLRRIKADARASVRKKNGFCETVVSPIYAAMNMNRAWIRRMKTLKASAKATSSTEESPCLGSNHI
ncbi:RNA dependent RNA polymerase-domain-containing protein [Radiomyces spectabilis]|uniref:RNA dependent RNA polymerase-domain-containing protein n=1 Tax=Radiomyces spectabilis TaxID=64574 RepID=UPI00221F46B8|nr:RNA dependent RNA polymerase-domain-containing protein [Radiomyces spectabilis]KAI8374113.1 RNA dependent RNA polymerase-domain-containing protein [Radiomyces spectabilis]